MTLVETILERAKAYSDRPAIITADGAVTLYGELEKVLPVVKEFSHQTSGTTGRPKSIVITDDNLRKRLARLEKVRGPAFAKLTSLFAPLGEQAPLGMQLKIHRLLKGGTLFRGGNYFDPVKWLDMCEQYSVEATVFIPKTPLFWRLLDVGHRYRFPQVFVSGSSARREDYERILNGLGQSIHVSYAASEVGQIAGASYDEIKDIPGCVGRIADDIEVDIIAGQVRIRCDTMVDGYADDPALTKERFKGGWFYPGDRGYFDGELLVIDGRV